MPESYEQAWRRMDEDYARRHREETALQIESTLEAHLWDGGFYCRCGQPVDLPRDWGGHLLELTLFDADDEDRP
jgi:hypothetical protein